MKASLWMVCAVLVCILFSGCKISGRIVDDNNQPLEGVTVVLGGADSKTVTTASDGRFVFERVKEGLYTVTPSFQNYVFKPADLQVVKGDDDVEDLMFLGLYQPPVALVKASGDTLVSSQDAGDAPPFACGEGFENGIAVADCTASMPESFTHDFLFQMDERSDFSEKFWVRTRFKVRPDGECEASGWVTEILSDLDGRLRVRFNGREFDTGTAAFPGDVIRQCLVADGQNLEVGVFLEDAEIFRHRVMVSAEDAGHPALMQIQYPSAAHVRENRIRSGYIMK